MQETLTEPPRLLLNHKVTLLTLLDVEERTISNVHATFIAAPTFSEPTTRLRTVLAGPGVNAWQCAGALATRV